LILRKIIKIVATRCHILRLKCTKFNFDQTPIGELTALHRTPNQISGVSFQAEGRGRKGRKEGINLPNGCLKKLGSTAKAAVNS